MLFYGFLPKSPPFFFFSFFETISYKNSETNPPPFNFNVVWICDCIWVDSSCYTGSLHLRNNIKLGEGGIRIGIYYTLSTVLKILTGFDQVSIHFVTDCGFDGAIPIEQVLLFNP